MLALIVGCLKWAAVGFVVAFVLMKLYEGSHIHDDIPRPDFKVRQPRRARSLLLCWNFVGPCLAAGAKTGLNIFAGRNRGLGCELPV
jgi:hypothetical protein